MDDWLRELGAGQRVLDVASAGGSFGLSGLQCSVAQLDEDVDAFAAAAPLPEGPYFRVFGRAGRLPFADSSFDLVICNHALEHIAPADDALREIGRVLKPRGRLYVSVPNGYGLCDGIYRWVFEGGGHLNRFRRHELAHAVEANTGLKLIRWQRLYSSFVYLYRLHQLLRTPPKGLSKRLLGIRRWPDATLKIAQHLLYRTTRRIDRWFGTQSAVYGWAMYFEHAPMTADPVEARGFINVCICCGAGHPADQVQRSGRRYTCPACQASNPWFAPFQETE